MKRATDGSVNGTVTRAVLIRDIPVCLLNVSLSGCLLESRTRLQTPVAGQLRVIVNGEARVDDIRLSRCVFVEGSGVVYRAVAEFLWTDLPGERSVRKAVRLFQDGGRHVYQPLKTEMPETSREMTETSRTAIDTAQPESK
jgi:hypothetical protein